ncbi:MAG: UDP-N-acetylmuramoyl-L-alanyl-D-glutamate--2,6-diaminopimelate ligase [Omnitrophica bacterium]|nr:UDP-N-acetylmuramoyl-L-alanyl-D-glutamate--2,6-diaminopimelate ligase [Candidatus Omnitrophota bacterium]
MKLRKLIEGSGAGRIAHLPEIDIKAVSTNSKAIKKGSLFVAIKGFKMDGRNFLKEAFLHGAEAAVVQGKIKKPGNSRNIITVRDARKAVSVIAKNFYKSPSERLKTVGITGTNGKTTIALLVESMLRGCGVPCGIIGTIEYRFGRDRISAERTTPDALLLNSLLDRMLKQKAEAVVMEVSSHALCQGRVDNIFFDAAIFTNLTREHLDYHGNIENYFKSKMRIFRRLKKNGIAIINADDKKAVRMEKILKCKKITYGLKKRAALTGIVKKLDVNGSSFDVRLRKKYVFSIDTKLVGLHNISNILAASALGLSFGLDPLSIKEGIERVKAVRGRLEPVGTGGRDFSVFVDYAHTHDALENVLKFLNHAGTGKIITVFGCGGERDRGKRPLMGRIAQDLSDFSVITNDNPRGESPEKIVREIEKGMDRKKRNYTVALNRKKAIEIALKKAGKDDIVLLAGKGHETEQVLRRRKIFFNDKKTAEDILAGPYFRK